MGLRAWVERTKDRSAKRLAWLLPRRVVRWAYIRVGAHATTGEYGSTVVPELGMMDALKRWDEAASTVLPPGPMTRKLWLKKHSPGRLLCLLGVHRWVGHQRDYCWRWGCGASPRSVEVGVEVRCAERSAA
jgi:hypothetical protein